jgi:hypothetical protein
LVSVFIYLSPYDYFSSSPRLNLERESGHRLFDARTSITKVSRGGSWMIPRTSAHSIN